MSDANKMDIPTPSDRAQTEKVDVAQANLQEPPVQPEQKPEEVKAAAEAKEAEEEAKPKKKKEEDIVEEKTYTIPLQKALIMPPRKRAPRAMHMIRAFIMKHMKVPLHAEEEDDEPPTLIITKEVNEHVWSQGIEKPPRKIRVRATKDSDGNVTVHLAEA